MVTMASLLVLTLPEMPLTVVDVWDGSVGTLALAAASSVMKLSCAPLSSRAAAGREEFCQVPLVAV